MNIGSTLWKSQPLDSAPPPIDRVKQQAEKLNEDYRTQVRAAYAGIGVCAGLFLLTFLPLPGYDLEVVQKSVRWALLALVIGGVYLLLEIKRRADALRVSDQEVMAQGLDSYRIELARRRDYYLGAWRWSFLPALGALAIIVVGGLMYDPGPVKVLRYSIAAATTGLAIVFGIWFQLRKGNDYQRELDALSSAGADTGKNS